MVRLGLVASLFAATAGAVSMDHVHSKNVISRIPGAYIFEFEDDNDPTDFYAKVAEDCWTRMDFKFELFKGASIQFNDLQRAEELASKMLELPAVKTMYPVQVYGLSKPKLQWSGNPDQEVKNAKKNKRSLLGLINHLLGNDNSSTEDAGAAAGSQQYPKDEYSVHTMTQIDKLRAEGYTGKGIKIGIVDSGVDYNHPALGGCFGPGCLVAGGTDLVGDNYSGVTAPKPDDDPMDCEGHGTHVAGIIAAQENDMGFTGAAPGASIYAYRAFGCSAEGVGSDVLIAAYSHAYEDGVDIISASIAAPSGWSEEAWSVVVSRITAKGIPCVVAAGNAGDQGQFYASAGASGKGVVAVSSFDDTHTPTLLNISQYTVNNSSTIDFGSVYGKPAAWPGVKLPLWALTLDTSVSNDGCQTFPSSTPDLSNYIVLLRRGTCSFDKKAKFAHAAGAKYVLIYNSDGKLLVADATSVKGIEAIGMVNDKQGEEWIKLLKTGSNIVLEMPLNSTMGVDYAENKVTGGALSTFSSWGPTWEMDVKPQFGCPGGHILSTYPVAKGSYAIHSGTSMATPLMAGIFALVAQVRGSLEPRLIENLLSATSNPQRYNDGKTWSKYLAPVPQQGAGLVQAYEAAFSRVILSPSSLSFNDTDNFVPSRNFSLTNTGTDTVEFEISHVPSVTVFTFRKGQIYPATFPNEVTQSHATVEFSENKVVVGPRESVTIEVLATPPQNVTGERLPVWSGWVAINGTDGSSLSIPYQGLTGSLHNATVLTDHDCWVSTSKSSTLSPVDANITFPLPKAGTLTSASMKETNDVLPTLVTFLALGTLELRADVVPIRSGLNPDLEVPHNGSIGQLDSYPALANPMGTSSLTWTGQLANGSYAPTGMYKIVYRALKIFGNPNNESDWDICETTPFGIKYAT